MREIVGRPLGADSVTMAGSGSPSAGSKTSGVNLRRTAMLFLSFVLAAGTISARAGQPDRDQAGRRDRRPNVLLVITDDQRGLETLSVMPQLRKLFRREGVRFSNAYATTPQCCPSRASIMTGQYAHNHGVRSNEDAPNLRHDTTIQSHLWDAGYTTGIVGKFLNGWPIEAAPPYFDRFSMFSSGYFNTRWNLNGQIRTVPDYSTNFIADRASQFIRRAERNDENPWYLYVAPFAPHVNSIPEKRYRNANVGRFRTNPAVMETDCTDKPVWVDCAASMWRIKKSRRDMLRTLLSVDDLVAQIQRVLDRTDEDRRTLVFLMSDNGYMWGEHGLLGKKPPYRGGIEIPMVMSWPGHVPEGTTDDRIVANIDVAPTIYDATGVQPTVTVDGRSLLDTSWERSRLLLEFEQTKKWPDWASNLYPDAKYTEYYAEDGATLFREHYLLDIDPWELDNTLADTDPTNDPSVLEQAELASTLMGDRSCAGANCP